MSIVRRWKRRNSQQVKRPWMACHQCNLQRFVRAVTSAERAVLQRCDTAFSYACAYEDAFKRVTSTSIYMSQLRRFSLPSPPVLIVVFHAAESHVSRCAPRQPEHSRYRCNTSA